MKLNLGAGKDIYDGWVNHDISKLPGVNEVHDLNLRPWPWVNGEFTEVLARDIFEHLDDFIPAMEELWRIMQPGAIARIRVPYMGSWSFHADPTHKRAFHETTFMYFDPSSNYCLDRPYYTHARFRIVSYSYVCAPFIPFFAIPGIGEFRVNRRWSKAIVGFIALFFVSNLIQGLDINIERIISEI